MKNLLSLGRSLKKSELKEVKGGNFNISDEPQKCDFGGGCPEGQTCDISAGECVDLGGDNGGGICPHNFGQNCDSVYDLF